VRVYQDGVPFGTPSSDLGGFKERVAPGAFTKTLSEHREIAAMVFQRARGISFNASPMRVEFQVIHDRWLLNRRSGELTRELIEVRVIGASPSELTGNTVSIKARAIAAGVGKDFIAIREAS
jgi:hypothetical protein